jgi:TRAP-type C4-dicarboxylate transport system permease small subunit
LLFLQWPLREYLGSYSRQANDLGQLLFALYVALGVTAATRAGAHLATDALARRYPPRVRQVLQVLCDVFALAPWAIFLAVSAKPLILRSLDNWERFPDTGNDGYFIVKLSLWLLAGGLLLAVAIDLALGGHRDDSR